MNESEKEGLELFQKLDLKAYGDLGHIPLSQLFPEQSFPSNLHCEFDYFILFGSTCLVGEISGMGNKQDIKKNTTDSATTFLSYKKINIKIRIFLAILIFQQRICISLTK